MKQLRVPGTLVTLSSSFQPHHTLLLTPLPQIHRYCPQFLSILLALQIGTLKF